MNGEDIGLALARAPAGVILMGHRAQKLFGLFGGGGLAKTGEQMEGLGYPRGKAMAALAGLTEITSGAAIATGTCTPVAAAGVVGVMTNATFAAHRRAGLWNQNGGYEYPLVLATLSVGLAAHGPGRLSVDHHVWERRTDGIWWAAAALGTGLAAAAAVLRTRTT